jgi:hypothetical protein
LEGLDLRIQMHGVAGPIILQKWYVPRAVHRLSTPFGGSPRGSIMLERAGDCSMALNIDATFT